jgi:large subunit ribosomal protein L35
MPKLKTIRGAAKRFRKTANGYKCRSAGRRHIMFNKSTKRKRQLRGESHVAKVDCPAIAQMMPNG